MLVVNPLLEVDLLLPASCVKVRGLALPESYGVDLTHSTKEPCALAA